VSDVPNVTVLANHMSSDISVVCDKKKYNNDLLGTKELATRFFEQVISINNEGIFAVTAKQGYGKTTFLFYLYCKLKSENINAVYIDAFRILIYSNVEDFDKLISKTHSRGEKIVYLIDNLEKCRAEDIIALLYKLQEQLISKQAHFVLSYDYEIVHEKLKKSYGEESKTNDFFDGIVELSYCLHLKATEIYINSLLENRLIANILEILKDELTLQELNLLAKKMNHYIRVHNNNEEKTPEELFYFTCFVLLKHFDRKKYHELHMKYNINNSNADFEKEINNMTLNKVGKRIIELLDDMNIETAGYGELTQDILKLFKEMELSNV